MANPKHLDYAKRSGDDAIESKNYIENEHGFASWDVEGDVFRVIQIYGDGKYWDRYLRQIAKEHRCKTAIFHTRRNPEAWKRRYNAQIVETCMMIELEY